jgi:hypothetical protein
MKYFKKNRRVTKATNAIDPATTTSKNWGFIPVPNKCGKTTNFEIPEDMFKRELKEMKEGIIHA